MLKVTVASPALDHIQGLAKLSGKPYSMFKQTVYYHIVDKNGVEELYPEKGNLLVEKDAVGNGIPYAPGIYFVHPSSFRLDRNGGLEIGTRLVRQAPASVKPV